MPADAAARRDQPFTRPSHHHPVLHTGRARSDRRPWRGRLRGRTARQPPRSRHRRRRRSRADLVGLDAADRGHLESVPAAGELVGASARRVPAARGPSTGPCSRATSDGSSARLDRRDPPSSAGSAPDTLAGGRGRVPPVDRVRLGNGAVRRVSGTGRVGRDGTAEGGGPVPAPARRRVATVGVAEVARGGTPGNPVPDDQGQGSSRPVTGSEVGPLTGTVGVLVIVTSRPWCPRRPTQFSYGERRTLGKLKADGGALRRSSPVVVELGDVVPVLKRAVSSSQTSGAAGARPRRLGGRSEGWALEHDRRSAARICPAVTGLELMLTGHPSGKSQIP